MISNIYALIDYSISATLLLNKSPNYGSPIIGNFSLNILNYSLSNDLVDSTSNWLSNCLIFLLKN